MSKVKKAIESKKSDSKSIVNSLIEIGRRDYTINGNRVDIKSIRSPEKNAQNINQMVQGSNYTASKATVDGDSIVIDVNLAIQYFINNVID